MKIFDFETVKSFPCLYHPDLDLIVLSDLHLGLEGSVSHQGNYVPQFQLEGIKKDIRKAKHATGASRVLINGDLKHEFKRTRFSEKKEIKEFIQLMKELFEEVIVVKGNHDTFLEEILSGVEFKESYTEEELMFVHGHKSFKPDKDYSTLVIGHEHPALELKDEIGVTEKIDCFLYGEMKNGAQIIVTPAFSKISGGQRVNNIPSSELLSPILRNEVDLGKLKAIGVDREAGLFEFPELRKLR